MWNLLCIVHDWIMTCIELWLQFCHLLRYCTTWRNDFSHDWSLTVDFLDSSDKSNSLNFVTPLRLVFYNTSGLKKSSKMAVKCSVHYCCTWLHRASQIKKILCLAPNCWYLYRIYLPLCFHLIRAKTSPLYGSLLTYIGVKMIRTN